MTGVLVPVGVPAAAESNVTALVVALVAFDCTVDVEHAASLTSAGGIDSLLACVEPIGLLWLPSLMDLIKEEKNVHVNIKLLCRHACMHVHTHSDTHACTHTQ